MSIYRYVCLAGLVLAGLILPACHHGARRFAGTGACAGACARPCGCVPFTGCGPARCPAWSVDDCIPTVPGAQTRPWLLAQVGHLANYEYSERCLHCGCGISKKLRSSIQCHIARHPISWTEASR